VEVKIRINSLTLNDKLVGEKIRCEKEEKKKTIQEPGVKKREGIEKSDILFM